MRLIKMESQNVRPEYVRRREAARFMGLSEGTLRNWASSYPRRGPSFFKVSGIVLYEMSELRRFVSQGLVAGGAQ